MDCLGPVKCLNTKPHQKFGSFFFDPLIYYLETFPSPESDVFKWSYQLEPPFKTSNPGLMATGDFKVHQILIEKQGNLLEAAIETKHIHHVFKVLLLGCPAATEYLAV